MTNDNQLYRQAEQKAIETARDLFIHYMLSATMPEQGSKRSSSHLGDGAADANPPSKIMKTIRGISRLQHPTVGHCDGLRCRHH